MKRFLCLVLFVLILAGTACAENAIVSNINEIFYVKTNGGHLNVRAWPDTDATIMGRLSYGQRVTVTGFVEDNSWARISYGGSTAYVLARYLSTTRPGYSPTTVPVVTPIPVPVQPTTDPFQQVNTQFDTMIFVDAYQVTVHPSRIGGWVNLRWGPSLDMSVIRYCYEGERLTVLARNETWYQVNDGYGHVGFIMRNYCY